MVAQDAKEAPLAYLAKIILEDDEPRELLVHTGLVQQQGLVLVDEARDSESDGHP